MSETAHLEDFGVIDDAEKRFERIKKEAMKIPMKDADGEPLRAKFYDMAFKKDPKVLEFVRADRIAKSIGIEVVHRKFAGTNSEEPVEVTLKRVEEETADMMAVSKRRTEDAKA